MSPNVVIPIITTELPVCQEHISEDDNDPCRRNTSGVERGGGGGGGSNMASLAVPSYHGGSIFLAIDAGDVSDCSSPGTMTPDGGRSPVLGRQGGHYHFVFFHYRIR